MSFARAVGFLWVASVRNRARKQLERLRQPRYLLGALVALGYMYLVLVRRFEARGPPVSRESTSLFLQAMLAGSSLLTVLSAWAFGADRPSVTFSEGEIQHFLPAPVTRAALLRYKLLRGYLGGALGVLIASLFMFRALGNPFWLFLVGGLVSFAVVYLHVTAASFVRTRLAAHGWRGTALRWLVLVSVLAALASAVLVAAVETPLPEPLRGWRDLQGWLAQVLAEPTLAALSWPVRVLVALPLSPDVGSFLRRLPAPLALLALHYAWVMAMRIPFEEPAVLRGEARARERALRMEGPQGLRGRPLTVRGSPFGPLSPVGRPEVALFWKNLVGGWRLGGPHSLLGIILFGALIQAVLGLFSPRYASVLRMTLAPTAGLFALLLCLLGPSMFRNDLRMDLRKLDLLRAMPLTGRQVVAAELLAPALMLALIEVLLVAATVVLGMGIPLGQQAGEWGAGAWVAGGLAAALVLPAVSLAGLFVQNAAVVLFPSWLPPEEGARARGLEALGQRLLTLIGTVLVLLVGLAPAALAAALVGLGLHFALGLGVWALPLGGLAAAGVLVGEVGFGVLALGRAFDGLDLSGEGPGLGG